MNTTLKPPITSQNSSAPNQLNKSMHPQGSPAFNQPSGHMSQNPYPNINVAHNHPNAQANHFSLNVPNATSHFNMGSIPASNHPVASISQSAAGQQIFNQQKSANYSSSYQPNLGHPPNQNTIPPVSQTLPATPPIQSQQQTQTNSATQKASGSPNTAASTPDVATPEKPQSNGTPELKTPDKSEGQSNHVSSPSPAHPQIPQASQVPIQQAEKLPEKAKTQLIQEQKPPPPEPAKPAEEPKPQSALTQPSTNKDVDPLATEEPKVSTPAETSHKSQEKKEAESAENLSVTPMETDPLATEKDEAEKIISTKEPTSSSTEIKDPLEMVKDHKENSDRSAQEKSTNEDIQEDETRAQAPTSKLNEPETPAKTTAQRPARKSKTPKSEEAKSSKPEPKTSIQKSPSTGKIKRQRTKTQHYQSPLPEIEIVTKMTSSTPRNRNTDDKLIYFYKNEFLAVRNAEGGFYLCQAVQNIYKSSMKIKIRWLSQDKNDKSGEIYTPDFYDLTDFDCILTSLDLDRVDKGKYRLTKAEKERTDSILKRCLAVEKGEIANPSVSEEHPDGLDLSLYKDEEQLKMRKGTKRKSSSVSKKKGTATQKSPDAPKVQKVETPKPKEPAVAAKKVSPRKASPPAEPKKAVPPSKASKNKRKSDTKTSPVVDQKKAKVLARIGRKTAISASSTRSQPAAPPAVAVKSGKPSKPVPSTSKAPAKPTAAAATLKAPIPTRKTSRSTRK